MLAAVHDAINSASPSAASEVHRHKLYRYNIKRRVMLQLLRDRTSPAVLQRHLQDSCQ